MPLVRRRPLLRAAMVGGAGYAAGKHRAHNRAHQEAQERMEMRPDPEMIPVLIDAAQSLKGSQKRLFMAKTVKATGRGG